MRSSLKRSGSAGLPAARTRPARALRAGGQAGSSILASIIMLAVAGGAAITAVEASNLLPSPISQLAQSAATAKPSTISDFHGPIQFTSQVNCVMTPNGEECNTYDVYYACTQAATDSKIQKLSQQGCLVPAFNYDIRTGDAITIVPTVRPVYSRCPSDAPKMTCSQGGPIQMGCKDVRDELADLCTYTCDGEDCEGGKLEEFVRKSPGQLAEDLKPKEQTQPVNTDPLQNADALAANLKEQEEKVKEMDGIRSRQRAIDEQLRALTNPKDPCADPSCDSQIQQLQAEKKQLELDWGASAEQLAILKGAARSLSSGEPPDASDPASPAEVTDPVIVSNNTFRSSNGNSLDNLVSEYNNCSTVSCLQNVVQRAQVAMGEVTGNSVSEAAARQYLTDATTDPEPVVAETQSPSILSRVQQAAARVRQAASDRWNALANRWNEGQLPEVETADLSGFEGARAAQDVGIDPSTGGVAETGREVLTTEQRGFFPPEIMEGGQRLYDFLDPRSVLRGSVDPEWEARTQEFANTALESSQLFSCGSGASAGCVQRGTELASAIGTVALESENQAFISTACSSAGACGPGQYQPGTWNPEYAATKRSLQALSQSDNPSARQVAQGRLDYFASLERAGIDPRTDGVAVATVMAHTYSSEWDKITEAATAVDSSNAASLQIRHFGIGHFQRFLNNPDSSNLEGTAFVRQNGLSSTCGDSCTYRQVAQFFDENRFDTNRVGNNLVYQGGLVPNANSPSGAAPASIASLPNQSNTAQGQSVQLASLNPLEPSPQSGSAAPPVRSAAGPTLLAYSPPRSSSDPIQFSTEAPDGLTEYARTTLWFNKETSPLYGGTGASTQQTVQQPNNVARLPRPRPDPTPVSSALPSLAELYGPYETARTEAVRQAAARTAADPNFTQPARPVTPTPVIAKNQGRLPTTGSNAQLDQLDPQPGFRPGINLIAGPPESAPATGWQELYRSLVGGQQQTQPSAPQATAQTAADPDNFTQPVRPITRTPASADWERYIQFYYETPEAPTVTQGTAETASELVAAEASPDWSRYFTDPQERLTLLGGTTGEPRAVAILRLRPSVQPVGPTGVRTNDPLVSAGGSVPDPVQITRTSTAGGTPEPPSATATADPAIPWGNVARLPNPRPNTAPTSPTPGTPAQPTTPVAAPSSVPYQFGLVRTSANASLSEKLALLGSYDVRSEFAEQLGIQNYSGTAAQNRQLVQLAESYSGTGFTQPTYTNPSTPASSLGFSSTQINGISAATAQYQGDSIVDFCSAAGLDCRSGSSAARTNLAQLVGIVNYTPSGSNNIELLRRLRVRFQSGL